MQHNLSQENFGEQTAEDLVVLADGGGGGLGAFELQCRQLEVADRLRALGVQRVALVADNSVESFVIHAAAERATVSLVPLPPFFSAEQMHHAIRMTCCNAILTDDVSRVEDLFPLASAQQDSVLGLAVVTLPTVQGAPVPANVSRITFTSGTTGTPKGVCLSTKNLAYAGRTLAEAIRAEIEDVHLALLPLSVLLEEVVAVYGGLYSGARVVVPSLREVGYRCCGGVDGKAMLDAIIKHEATLLVLTPELLKELCFALEGSGRKLEKIRFIAVGGAPIPKQLLDRAQSLGLPVFEGYGLSEATSVVAMNTPQMHRPGTVGQLLPGAAVRLSEDGELWVGGNIFEGYLSESGFVAAAEELATGDLATIDADGFLRIVGRKKNIIITSGGRNVSPEWVEGVLEKDPAIRRAFVFGGGGSQLIAIIEPVDAKSDWKRAVREACSELPNYARIRNCVGLSEPLSIGNGTLGPTGKPVRSRIVELHEEKLSR